MAKDGRNRLVIALTLDAPGCKTVAKSMKACWRNAQLGEKFLEIIPVVTGLQRGDRIGNEIEIVGHDLAKRPNNLHELLAYWNTPYRRCCLRLANQQSIFLLISVGKPDPLDSLGDVDLPGGNIQILPLKGADLADTQPAVHANLKAEIPE